MQQGATNRPRIIQVQHLPQRLLLICLKVRPIVECRLHLRASCCQRPVAQLPDVSERQGTTGKEHAPLAKVRQRLLVVVVVVS